MTKKAAEKKHTEIRPLDDRIVVEPMKSDEKTAGGIFLPDTAKEKPQRGKVIAVGPGKLLDNGERAQVGVKVGDTVLFAKYGGTEVRVEGKDLLIMRQSDVLARIED
jgi:chaperonin GroES